MVITLQEIIDAIDTGTRPEKEALAQRIRNIETSLKNSEITQMQTESNTRRNDALQYITNTVDPQLTTQSGDYATQHSQLLGNLAILDTEIINSANRETKEELVKRKQTEETKFKQLRQDHANGVIT